MTRLLGEFENLYFVHEDYNNYLCIKQMEEMKLGI